MGVEVTAFDLTPAIVRGTAEGEQVWVPPARDIPSYPSCQAEAGEGRRRKGQADQQRANYEDAAITDGVQDWYEQQVITSRSAAGSCFVRY